MLPLVWVQYKKSTDFSTWEFHLFLTSEQHVKGQDQSVNTHTVAERKFQLLWKSVSDFQTKINK